MTGEMFVGVAHASETRRLLLEGSKEVLKVLRKIEDFQYKKEMRERLYEEFVKTMKEITTASNKLKKSLPSVGIRAASKKVESKMQIRKVPTTKAEQEKHIEMLEKELDDIEKRLKVMN